MDYLGKYILTTWKHKGGFVSKCLRRINRITSNGKYLISDVQRNRRNYDDGAKELIHVAKWASKFRVVDGEVKRPNSYLNNDDGTMKIEVVSDVDQLLCEYSYEELFEVDIRKIQKEKSNPRSWIENLNTYKKKHGIKLEEEDFYINPYHFSHFEEVNSFLKEFFQVDEVLYFSNYYENSNNFGILSQSATFFQITHFGGDKRVITDEENSPNMPIQFWYFGNKLVYTEEDGKNTW